MRVLAFGDFGDGSERQTRMAEAMARFHAKTPFDFAVTLGDNFYPAGMAGPADPRWQRDFERHYAPMHIRFYPTLGNHDWVLADSPAAEILYSDEVEALADAGRPLHVHRRSGAVLRHRHQPRHARPARVAGSRARPQHGALEDRLRASPDLLVRRCTATRRALRDKLLPVLRGRANIYLAGHDHDLQHIAPEDGVHFVSRAAAAPQPRAITAGPRSLFAASKNGFAVIEATRSALTVMLVDESLETLHQFVIRE